MDSKGLLNHIVGHPGFFVDPASGIIYWRKSIKGRAFKKSTGLKKINEAKKFIDDFVLSLTVESVVDRQRLKQGILNPQMSHIWRQCLAERRATRSATTKIRWQTVWNSDLEPFWGEKHLSDFNQNNVREFEKWFIENRGKNYFFSASKYLKMLINYCFKKSYIKEKLTVQNLDKIMPDKARRKKPFRIYTKSEQLALIENAVNERTKVALILYFDTGARKMEILKLKSEQVDFAKNLVELWSDKNKEWRNVPLTKRAAVALEGLIDKTDGSAFLFAMKRDSERHMASQVFDKDWATTKRLAGIKGRARVHDIRHTFASKTADDKWSVKEACDVLDMTPNVYLNTYVHVSWESIVSAHSRSFDV